MRATFFLTNAFECSYFGQIHDMFENQQSETIDVSGDSIDRNGDLTIPLSVQPTAFTMSGRRHGHDSIIDFIRKEINSNILEVESNYEHMMNFFNSIYSEEKAVIYGVLVVYGEVRINPLHPFIAKMIADKSIVLPETFKLIVYQLRKEKNAGKLDSDLALIGKSLKAFGSKEEHRFSTEFTETPYEYCKAYMRNSRTNMNAFDRSITRETLGVNPTYAVAPVQKMGTGITYPFYGLAGFVFQSGQYQSINMYPFASGNLNTSGGDRFNSTCTGSLPNNKFQSLSVINDMKISSMHHEKIIPNDWVTFLLACQVSSITILKGEIDGKEEKQQQKEGEQHGSSDRIQDGNKSESTTTNERAEIQPSFAPPF